MRRQTSGFALIVALSLMSFIILILLSLSTLVSVELATTQQSQAQLTARENARLALMIALGELQKHAGPDQRVTARAEILDDGNYDPAAKNWTGIWDSANTGTPTAWFVTGMPTSAASVPNKAIAIVPEFDLDADGIIDHEAVQVPLAEAPTQDGLPGNYGWWVSDESTKASIAAGRDTLVNLDRANKESERQFYEYQSPFGVNLLSIFENVNVDSSDLETASTLQRVQYLSELPAINDSAGFPITNRQRLKSKRHDLTVTAFGVLENLNQGGLKRNLSDPDYRDSFLANDELAEFIGNRGDTLKVESGIPAEREAGNVIHSPRPLPTEIALYVGVFHTQSDGKIRLRYHMEGEFMNPYSLPLKFDKSLAARYDQGLVVYFENLPTITVSDTSRITLTPTITEDLNNFASPSYEDTDSRKFINSWFEFIPTDLTSDEPTLLAGEVFQVMEPNANTQQRGLARDFVGSDNQRWSGNRENIPTDSARISISAEHPLGGVNLIIVPFEENSANIQDREPIYEIRGLEFENFTITKEFKTGDNPFSRATSSDYQINDYIFAYHFRIGSDESQLSSLNDVLTSLDLRDATIDTNDKFEDIAGRERDVEEILDIVETDPSLAIGESLNFFRQLDQIMDRDERSHTESYRKSFLYDMPIGHLTSVGQLSAVHIYKRKPRSIGNPWGAEYNQVFDRYYFSPKIVNQTTGDPFMANPWLVSTKAIVPTPDEDDSESELVVGSFNINSTSKKAWEAILSAPVLTPRAEDETTVEDEMTTRPNAFFRLPQYQSTDPGFHVADTAIQDPNNAFAQGIRVLDGNIGALQIKALAQNIVSNLKEKGEPFANLEDFVNSGILQRSIDEVGTDDKTGPSSSSPIPAINSGIHEYSNLFLTQSDILTKIAPFITTRSDTYVIRAYGEVRNPFSNEITGTAICEAIIQRFPDQLDGSDPTSIADIPSGGRSLRIMDFKWINEDF